MGGTAVSKWEVGLILCKFYLQFSNVQKTTSS